jgi:hypothetical protein
MTCPNCEIELKCPCKSCQKRRKDRGEVAALLEEWPGNDLIRCPVCGFTHTMDFWEDFAFYQYDKTRGALLPEQETRIKTEIEKWRAKL